MSDYSSMTVREFEERIERILKRQRHQDDLFRAVVFMGQLDLAKFIYHDKRHQPESRYSGLTKSSETIAYGQALVQLLLLAKSRGMDFQEVFKYALEHMEGFEEFKARASENHAEVRGMPVGKGMVKGTAYVVSQKNPIEKAPMGSILVLEHADSEVSHLIRNFSAVISDQGGRLCHLAVVAREMKMPAIVGTGNATSLISTGDMVAVDANSGRVTVEK
ncbi:MAG TPA: PEP-utilizing enzyme [archaeon]|nr:PEP-utilizing enzyme [archaeon]